MKTVQRKKLKTTLRCSLIAVVSKQENLVSRCFESYSNERLLQDVTLNVRKGILNC